jgi:hypothetical protein
MSMLWNQRWSTMTTEKRGTMFVRVFRAATIVAVASFAADSDVIAAQEVKRPDINLLPENAGKSIVEPTISGPTLEPILEFLRAQEAYKDASEVLIVSINYKTESGGEKLVAFKVKENATDSLPQSQSYPTADLRIPGEGPGEWEELSNGGQAIVIYTMSHGAVKACSGGLGTVTC